MQGISRELPGYEARGRIEKFSAIFSLIILGLTICFLGLSIYGLFDVDETRYAAAAIEMVQSKNYLIPVFNGEPRLTQPIFYYWLLAGFVHIFGPSPGTFRLVSAVFAFGLVLVVGHIVYRESRVEGGFLAGVMLATSLFFAYMGRVATADMVFSVLLFLSSILLYLGTFDEKKVNRTMIRFGTCAMALAVITEGPAGAILPLLCLFLFSWLNGRLKRMADALRDLKAIILFLAVALPWYVVVYFKLGADQFYVNFIRDTFDRFLGIDASHSGPIYYYVPVIIAGMYPWSFFLPQTFFSILKERGFSLKAVGENISIDWFLLLYSVVIFIFFSLSATKVATYILSIFPAFAIILALYLEKVMVNPKYPDLGFAAGAYAYSFFSFLFGILFIYPKEYFPIVNEAGLQDIIFYPGLLLVMCGIFVMFLTVLRKKISRPRVKIFAAVLIPQLLFLWFIFFAVLPDVYQYRQADLQHIADRISSIDDGDAPVIFYRKFKPSIVMLTGRLIHQAKNYEEVIAYTRSKKNAYLIFPGADPLVDLSSIGPVLALYQGNLYSLYKVRVR